jgi:hypothetical protein
MGLRAADKETPFRAQPAASYPNHQINQNLTVGVDAFSSPAKTQTAFGKLNPNEHGILPVLVVIQNDSSKAVRLDRMKLEYVGPARDRVEATPAREVRFLKGPDRPGVVTGPTGSPKIARRKKNPLEAWEIEGRAFSARMLPPGQSASGFFYFQTGLRPGATLYLTGIAEADTGKELFYFEVPLR